MLSPLLDRLTQFKSFWSLWRQKSHLSIKLFIPLQVCDNLTASFICSLSTIIFNSSCGKLDNLSESLERGVAISLYVSGVSSVVPSVKVIPKYRAFLLSPLPWSLRNMNDSQSVCHFISLTRDVSQLSSTYPPFMATSKVINGLLCPDGISSSTTSVSIWWSKSSLLRSGSLSAGWCWITVSNRP